MNPGNQYISAAVVLNLKYRHVTTIYLDTLRFLEMYRESQSNTDDHRDFLPQAGLKVLAGNVAIVYQVTYT